MSDNNKPKEVIKVEQRGSNIKVVLGTNEIPKLLTALKMAEFHIDNLILKSIQQQDQNKIAVPKGLIDKLRGR